MSLPGSQQRVLAQIERTLLQEDGQLGSLFSIFTRLTSHEPMPWVERAVSRPWPLRLRVGMATAMAIGLAAVVSVLVLLAPGRQACLGGGASSPAHLEPFRAGQQDSCKTRQPARTSRAAAGPS
jgi:hypothetical protein